MPKDHSLPFRRALVTLLNADPTVSGLVTKTYGPAVVSTAIKPFIRVGPLPVASFEATCLEGMESDFPIHVFTSELDESLCSEIAAAVQSALEDQVLTFSGAHTVSLDWRGTVLLPPGTGEADEWHGVVTFNVVTADDF